MENEKPTMCEECNEKPGVKWWDDVLSDGSCLFCAECYDKVAKEWG